MSETADIDPASTEFVIIRPETNAADSDLADIRDGEWRKRSELTDESAIDLLGPNGVVRAYPTQRIERSRAGDLAQTYEVPFAEADE